MQHYQVSLCVSPIFEITVIEMVFCYHKDITSISLLQVTSYIPNIASISCDRLTKQVGESRDRSKKTFSICVCIMSTNAEFLLAEILTR